MFQIPITRIARIASNQCYCWEDFNFVPFNIQLFRHERIYFQFSKSTNRNPINKRLKFDLVQLTGLCIVRVLNEKFSLLAIHGSCNWSTFKDNKINCVLRNTRSECTQLLSLSLKLDCIFFSCKLIWKNFSLWLNVGNKIATIEWIKNKTEWI